MLHYIFDSYRGESPQYLPDAYNSKAKLETLVVRLGGSLTQNDMGDSTDFIIAAADSNVRVRRTPAILAAEQACVYGCQLYSNSHTCSCTCARRRFATSLQKVARTSSNRSG